MIKRFLTYLKTGFNLPGLLLLLLLYGCGIEPDKSRTKQDIMTYVMKDCQVAEWYDFSRQGSFQTDQRGRHRFYRCFLELEFDQTCDLPTEIVPGQQVHGTRYLQFIPGRQELSVYIDYLETEDGWEPVQFVISDDVESIFKE